MNPKKPASREKQEHEDSRHAVYRSGCLAGVEGRGVGGHQRTELWDEEERENDSHCCLLQRFHDTRTCRHVSSSGMSRQWVMVRLERRVANGKVPQHTPFHFLVSSKVLVFAESF